ncbi:MAG: hypothetical protein ACYC3T_11315, partial [Candidatus Humimicrobiaceae bacterium]
MILDNFFKEKNWQEFSKNPKTNIYAGENIWPLIIEGLHELYKTPFIVIVSTFDKNAELLEDFSCFENKKNYLNYPFLGEGIFFRSKQINSGFLSERLEILKKINSYDINQEPFVIITSISSLVSLMPRGLIKNLSDFSFDKGMKYKRDDLASKLIKSGYERVYKVYDKGEFSIKGDIIDIFDMSSLNPVRLDFFDDSLERIHYYDVLNQEFISETNNIALTPNFNPWKVQEKKDYLSDNSAKSKAEEYVSLISLLKEKIDNPGIVICDPLEVYLKLKSEIDIIEKSIATQKDNLISSDENLIKKYIPQRDFLESETSSLKFNLVSSRTGLEDENDFEFNEIKVQKQNFG